MAEPKREELKVDKKRAVLVAVFESSRNGIHGDPLDELRGLVTTAGVNVVGTLTQVRSTPNAATYLGRGKVEELKLLIEATQANLVVFDNHLSPGQSRNLEKETNTMIVDRSEVILDIFASRAQTYEAKLQVELAQLLYFRPRLKRMWTHLERIEGGIGARRGPGEKQLETDRRLLDTRVAELKRKLRTVEKRRERTVAQRDDEMTVSLVGYTNAGKSTLMRALTGADVLVADKLFATLDTRTRRWKLPHCGDVPLSDTVGFVRDLPHHLVASFKSTLEEARNAKLLLHVVDASHPQAEQQIETVCTVLEEIGIDNQNTILVLNKSDAVEDRSVLDVLRLRHENAVCISAAEGTGLDRLGEVVAERLGEGFVDAAIETDVGDGRLLAYLARHADVKNTQYHDSRVVVTCRMPRRIAARLEADGVSVTVQQAAFADVSR